MQRLPMLEERSD